MSDSQSKSVEDLKQEVVDLKIRIKRIEKFLLNTFPLTDPRGYIHEEEDEKYNEAVKIVQQFNTASASFLQRKMSIGYAMAARLLDTMEERGIVGGAEGAMPREVLKNTKKKQGKEKENG
ncbi:hypothetical protein KJ980_02885 [Patescibacteria group bacterium]|nr:hypothetical protein [Patescibacteria group bacterium]MBU4016070.1 hypothetical protein [Patescibacteria group bacterium]MBU4098571.1 hypothetical protein [Patescibacteria group bacterium]